VSCAEKKARTPIILLSVGEDYVYHIWPEKVRAVSVWDDETLFEGPWEEFLSFCLQYGLEEEEKI